MTLSIIGVSGSPRKNGNTETLVKEALKGAKEIGNVKTAFFSLAGKNIAHCKGCLACEKKRTICRVRDDFQDFFSAYMKADGIIIGSPVYHLSITSVLKAAIDRLGQSMFSVYRGRTPRLCKVGGIIAQGSALYGGQEFTLQFVLNSFILENCLVVSGDSPQSKLGVAASTYADSARGSIKKNETAMLTSKSLGRRVVEMAMIIGEGRKQLAGVLGAEYFENTHLKCIKPKERGK
jgi:multimeric flavodoxin WrbA